MPRARTQETLIEVAYPVTAAEVDAMFRSASKRGPWPDIETCANLATAFSALTLEGQRRHPAAGFSQARQMTDAEVRFRIKWDSAIKTLRKTRENLFSFPGADPLSLAAAADVMDAALDRASHLLRARPQISPSNSTTKRWAPYAVTWVHVISEIIKSNKRRGGGSRGGIATKVVTEALERIGWRDGNDQTITAGAIERYYRKFKNGQTE